MASLRPASTDVRLSAPWHYRLAKWLGRRQVRGCGLLIRGAEKLGMLNCVVRYPVAAGLTIDVPLYRRANQWDAQQIHDYESQFLDCMAAATHGLGGSFSLVDCGADIGLFTIAMTARCPEICRAIAFEPDAEAFPILAANLRRLPIETNCFPLAVGRAACEGELNDPAGNRSEHARFVAPKRGGPISIAALDDALAHITPLWRQNLLLKLDIEGSELDALQGAARLLTAVPRFVVGYEAHRLVMQRTGADPILCARHLHTIKPCRLLVAERPDVQLSLDRGFFEQVTDGDVFNVVAVS